MKLDEEGHRILAEARANVERLRDCERRFAAQRKEIVEARKSSPIEEPIRYERVESLNERHRREIDEQEKQFECERVARKREERRSKQADWSQWENWADAKIADALAHERRLVLPVINEEVKKAIEQIYDDVAAEVKALRLEIAALQSTLEQSVEQLHGMVRADKAKVIDLPNPLRRAN
jgi:hypothetical protein